MSPPISMTCPTCAAPILAEASFCAACGAPLTVAPTLRLAIDRATARDFTAGQRCLLRLRLESERQSFRGLTVAPRLSDVVLPAAQVDVAAGASASVTSAFVPVVPGQHELWVEVSALVTGEPVSWRFGPVHLRIRDAQSPSVHVVNIDQSAARVIDNSRASFAPDDGAGLLAVGDWQAIELAQVVRPVARPRVVAKAIDFTVTTTQGTYHADGLIALGELASIFAARTGAGTAVVLKIATDRADNDLLLNESAILLRLHAHEHAARLHLPVLLDQFRTADGRVGNVLGHLDGLDLTAVRERLPAGVPPRHLIWILRRALAVLGWAHSQGILHGNLDPTHILLRPGDHMVWVVDWCYGIIEPALSGDRFKAFNEVYSPPEVTAHKPPLPASDLYALGKCMFYAAGGDPASKTLPTMDERLARLLRFLVVDSALGRPGDAWQLYLEVDRIREQIWGPHVFEPFEL